jgi:hypothetical protein
VKALELAKVRGTAPASPRLAPVTIRAKEKVRWRTAAGQRQGRTREATDDFERRATTVVMKNACPRQLEMRLSNRGARDAGRPTPQADMLGRRFDVGRDSGEPGGGGVTLTTGSGGSLRDRWFENVQTDGDEDADDGHEGGKSSKNSTHLF